MADDTAELLEAAAEKRCPACHGEGSWKDVILDDGSGPSETCGYCGGSGVVSHATFFRTLGFLSAAAREKKRYQRAREARVLVRAKEA